MLHLLERTYISIFRRYPVLLRMAVVVLLAEIMFAAVNNLALPFYIHYDLRRPMAVVGDIISVFLMAEMFLKFWAGHLSDRYGRRHFISLGLAVCIGTPLAVIALPPTLLIATPVVLYLIFVPLRVVDGAGSAATWPPLFASVPDHIPSEDRGLAMSVVNSAYLAALALGPAMVSVSSWVAKATGHAAWSGRAPFIMAVLFALLASAVAWGLPTHSPHRERPRPGEKAVSLREALPPLMLIFVVLAITFSDMFATGVLAPYCGPYLSEVGGVPLDKVGFLMLLLVLPAGLLGMPIGHLTDRMERRRVVQAALAVTALGLWGVSLAHGLGQIIATASLVMLGFMFGLPSWLALITELAPNAGSGKIMGIMATAQGVGAFLGPMIGGRLWDINPRYPFYLAAGMLTLSSLIALIFIRRRKGKSAPVAEEACVGS